MTSTNPGTDAIAAARPTQRRWRGEGKIYHGSVVEARGAAVAAMSDCDCPPCAILDPWDPHRRASVLLTDGRRLVHAGFTSFTDPQDLDAHTLARFQREADRELRDQARTASMLEWRELHGAAHHPR